MRRLWPKTVRIYWDPELNIPVVKPGHDEIDLLYVLKLTEPGDARPVFPRDLEKLESAIRFEYGDSSIYDFLFKNRFLLFNKVPHWDQMWEVVASGNVMGQLFYDPFSDRWRFRLSYAGAYFVYEQGLVDTVRFEGRIYPKMPLSAGVSTSARQVLIIGGRGVVGLAERAGDGFIVEKYFRDRRMPVETSWRPASIDDVIRHNEYGLYIMEDKAVRFLRKVHEHHPLKPVVSYSGGKDSLTALHLTIKALGGAEMLFNDTGIELPDTVRNVEYVSGKYGLRLVKASAGDIFWKAVWIFGPPGKDYRWCCKVTKLVPIARTTRRVWPSGVLNIVGQRAYESMDRARSPSIWRNRWVPHLLSVTPIQDWGQLAEWLYIIKENLPYNPLYRQGFERLGCYVCPSSTLAEFKEVEANYPELWDRWVEVLEWWRRRLGQPEEWVRLGLWRWLTPSAAKHRLAHHIRGYSIDWRREYTGRLLNSRINLAPIDVSRREGWVRIVFNRDIVPDEAQQQFHGNVRMLHMSAYRDNDEIIVSTSKTRITIRGRNMEASYEGDEGFEDVADVLKIIYRIHGCAGCASCVLWCPYGLLRLTRYGPVPSAPCPGCHVCIDVCPVAEVLVERVVLPLITGDVVVWKRRGRRRGEEVLESFRLAGVLEG